MKQQVFAILVVFLGLDLLAPHPAVAQVQTGSVLIKAVDEQGGVMPGVTVSLSSPVMPRELTGITDSSGIFQVPGLAIGSYTIKTSLQGFQTVIREGIVVRQGQTADVEIALKVSSLAEEVTVKGESPVVDTRSANVNVSLDKNLLENTPGGKDIWNILEYKVPGLIFDVPDVGGNQAGLQRAFTARGTPNSQNTQLLNGVNVGDPAAIGFSMNYYDPSSFDNILVSSGAQDISVGTSGVVINMVTKSGTNRFTGQFLQTYQGDATQVDNIDDGLRASGFRPNANAVDYITNTNAQAGGPMLRNKLFYFGSFNYQPTHVNVPGFPAVSPIPVLLGDTSDQDTTDITTGTGRLTYQVSRHKFDFYASKQRYDKPNRGAGPTVTQDSASKEYDIDNVVQGLWSWAISNRLFANTNISYNNVHFPLYQKTALHPLTDVAVTPNVQYRNRTSSAIMFRERLEIQSNWNYYLPRLGGRHDFKWGFNNSFTPEDVTTERVDDVNLTFRSFATGATAPAGGVQVTVFNSPFTVKRAVSNTAFYAQDTYSIGRLTAIAGLRWERVEGYIPRQTRISSRYFPTGMVISGLNVALGTGGTVTQYVVPDEFAEVRNAPLWKYWAPRFAGTYDLTGNGKTIAKVSWGKYLDQIGTGTPGPNPNGTVSQRYTWNDQNSDLIFQPGGASWDGTKYVGGEFGALANNGTTIPNPNRFDPRDRTYRNELTAGVDREIFPGIRGSATYIRKRERDPIGTIFVPPDQWGVAYTPVPVIDPGVDGVTDDADRNAPVMAFQLNSGVTLAQRLINDDRLATRYDGVELTVEKRYDRGFALVGGYTYARTRVDLTSLQSPNALINAKGESGGRRHLFKVTGSYMFPYQILFGSNLRMQSGLPFTRTFTVQACSGTVTTNCLTPLPGDNNTTILAEPRGSRTLPSLITLDLRAGRFFRFGTNRVELSADVYNLVNANTIYDVRSGSGLTNVRANGDPNAPITQIQTFLSPTGVLGPRIWRVNITYQFGS